MEGPRSRKRKEAEAGVGVPDELYRLVPESRMYTQLQKLEHRVDGGIVRKKIEVNEALAGTRKAKALVKCLITHEVEREGKNTFVQMKVRGNVLQRSQGNTVLSQQAFCSVVRKIVVQFDGKAVAEKESTVEWVKSNAHAQSNGIEIKRQLLKEGDSACTVYLYLDSSPSLFKCAGPIHELAQHLGFMPEAVSKSTVLRALWQYVKTKELLDPANPLFINCDEVLSKAFGEERVYISALLDKIDPHLQPCDPIEVVYKMNVQGKVGLVEECSQSFNFQVDLPAPPPDHFQGWFESVPPYAGEVNEINQRIKMASIRLTKHKRRYEFLKAFSESPVEVIEMLIANQTRDLHIMTEWEAVKEAQRSASFYSDDTVGNWVPKAVQRYLEHLEGKEQPVDEDESE